MSPSGSCTRCSRPLPVESAGGLCPTCQSAPETSRLPGAPAAPDTTTYRPADAGTATFRPTDSGTQFIPPVRPDAPTPNVLDLNAARLPPAPPGYELVRRLGGGGMGDVYLARDAAAERLVALKFLRSPGNPAAADRFLAEVRALARLDHPHIVRVLAHDFLRADPFFAMEYAPGGSLSQRLVENGPLDPGEAARLVATTARALDAAHRAGVLHRDVKPSNVLVAADGSVRVSDFGLAKRTDRDDALTTGTGPVGTLAYMPPEQARRGAADRRSDVYGLGATLYHLLTGRPPLPVTGPDALNTLPPRPRAVRPDTPAGLEAVVMKCLEADPAARYPTAAALADDLDRFLAGRDTEAPRLTWWRRTRRWAVLHRVPLAVTGLVAGLAVGLAVAIAIAAQNRRPTDRPPVARQLPPVVAEWIRPNDPGRTPADLSQVHEQVRAELAAGRKFELVTRTQLRVPLGVTLGRAQFEGPEPDAPLRVTARGEAVAYLVPDAGLDRYRIRASIRQDRKSGDDDPKVPSAHSWVGLVLGHARVKVEGEWTAHLLTAAQFCEPDPNPAAGPPGPDHRLTVQTYARASHPRLATRLLTERLDVLPLPDRGPRPWREFVVDVGPDGVRVRHDGGEAFVPAAALARTWDDCRERAGRGWFDGATPPLPAWDPRLPVGLRLVGCTASFRDVVIEPRP